MARLKEKREASLAPDYWSARAVGQRPTAKDSAKPGSDNSFLKWIALWCLVMI